MKTALQDSRKTKAQLVEELKALRDRLTEAEKTEAGSRQAEKDFTEAATGHRRVEEALKTSEAIYRTIFDTANDAIFIHDMENGAILDVNQKMREMYGYTPEEIPNLVVGDLSAGDPPYSQDDALKWIKKAIAGEPQLFEWLAKDKAGKLFWVEVNLKRAKIREKNHLLAIVRDITERRQVEEALRKSEEMYRNIVENCRDVIMITRSDGIISYLSPACKKVLGHNPEDLVGRQPWIIHPDDLVKVKEVHYLALIGKGGSNFEYRIKTKTGKTKWVSHSWSLISANDELTMIISMVRDITEHRQNEEALREQRDQAQRYLDIAEVMFVALDTEGRITLLNKKGCRILGYEEEEIIGKNWFDTCLPERNRDDVRVVFKKLMAGEIEPVESYENAVLTKKGDEKIITWHNTVLTDEAGEIVGTLGSGEDITERKQAEKFLQESEERYRFLIENQGEGIAVLAPDESFTFCNPAGEEIFGVSPGTLVGRNLRKFLSPENFEIIHNKTEKRQSGERSTYEMEFTRPDGEKRQLLVTATPWMDTEGNFAGTFGIFRDITERKRMEEALHESEIQYRSLIEHSNDAIYLLHDGKFEIINLKFSELFGVTPEEVSAPDFNFMQLVAPRSQALIEQRKRMRKLDKGTPSRYEFIGLTKDGKEIELEASVSYVPYRGGTATQGILRDITERKRMQAQMFQAQKMEAIGTLAGGIAHDFNNILMAILGYTDMAISDIPKDNPSRENLEQALRAGIRAKDLVQQILTFSRQTEQETQPIQIQFIIKEALKLLRATLPTTIEMRQNISTKCCPVMADSTQIHQVVMNLCTNAYHAMRERGGVLDVSLKTVKVDEDFAEIYPQLKEGYYVRLTVSDTGCGMDSETMKRIFEPFFTTKNAGEGTGMGLAVAHGIISRYGGQIVAQSEQGIGSTFHVYLPELSRHPSEKIPADQSIPGGNETILFVDDEEPLVHMGKQMLERLGYSITARTSSIEALEAFRANPDKFDLVIVDQTMPNMTGIELAEALQCIRSNIPIILTTGFSEMITFEKIKQVGIREYLLKPILMSDLGIAVRRVLEKKENVS